MNKYEILYIVSAEIDDEAKDKVIKKFEGVITDNGGIVDSTEKWGNKKFAYPINYKTEGFYVLTTFQAQPEVPFEIERLMRIADEIIRFMIVKKG